MIGSLLESVLVEVLVESRLREIETRLESKEREMETRMKEYEDLLTIETNKSIDHGRLDTIDEDRNMEEKVTEWDHVMDNQFVLQLQSPGHEDVHGYPQDQVKQSPV